MTTALLSSTFFGPVQWYQKLCRYDRVFIEHCDSYQKQTYRNRCLIATTNGIQALTVPVVSENEGARMGHGETMSASGKATLANREAMLNKNSIRISDHGNWRHLHWQALQTAYGDSPFFDYYEDDLRPFFTERWEFLYDYNEAIRQTVCELLDIHPHVAATTVWQASAENDFRSAIQPKHPAPDPEFQPRPYYQVYARRHGFLPNLSILDLLLNMGPESIFYLLPPHTVA